MGTLFVVRHLLAAFTCLFISFFSFSSAASIDGGVAWLKSQQQADGRFDSTVSLASVQQATAESLIALNQHKSLDAAIKTKALQFLQGEPSQHLEASVNALRLNKALAANLPVAPITNFLAYSGGFGDYPGYDDSVFASAQLLASIDGLEELHSFNAANALSFLLGKQRSDKSWAEESNNPSLIVTAQVNRALQKHRLTFNVNDKIASSIQYLLKAQTPTGGWAGVLDTAQILLAVIPASSSPTAYEKALQFLTKSQLENGSWNNDPYTTAIALQVLYLVKNPPIIENKDLGSISGLLKSNVTGKPIDSARVDISGPSVRTIASNTNGYFNGASLSPGDYLLKITATGYQQVELNITLGSGAPLDVGVVQLKVLKDSGVISGRVTDGQTGAPLANVDLVLLRFGGGKYLTSTDAGGFYSQEVIPGQYNVGFALDGFYTLTKTVYVGNETENEFSPELHKLADGFIEEGYLHGTVSDPTAITGYFGDFNFIQGIEGVSVREIIGGASTVTDANGKFKIAAKNGLIKLIFEKNGFETKVLDGVFSGGADTSAGSVLMNPTSGGVFGKVIDAKTGAPVPYASIKADDIVVSSDELGAYRFSGSKQNKVTVIVSAAGYETQAYVVATSLSDIARYDFSLKKIILSKIDIVNFVSSSNSLKAFEVATFSGAIKNSGEETDTVNVQGQIWTPDGQLLQEVAISDQLGYGSPIFSLAAGETKTIGFEWNTRANKPGTYRIAVNAYSTETKKLLSQKDYLVDVLPTPMQLGAFAAYPPLVQAGSVTPVSLKASIRNVGNMALDAGTLEFTIAAENTEHVVYSKTQSVDSLSPNQIVDVDFGLWTPLAGQTGNYKVQIVRTDGIDQKIDGSIYVGDVGSASYSVDSSILNEGDSVVTGTIRLKGVDTTRANSVDPLYPLIKNAIERGAEYTNKEGVAWQEKNNCLGCHTQAQTVAGLGSSLERADVKREHALYFLNQIGTGQRIDGELETSSGPESKVSATLFAAWGISEWPHPDDTYHTTVNSLEFLWSRRQVSSEKLWWKPDLNTGWLNSEFSATALVATVASRAIEAKGALSKVHNEYSWGATIPTNHSNTGLNAITAAGDSIYVVKRNGWTEKINPVSRTTEILFRSVAGISNLVHGVHVESSGNFLMTTYTGEILRVTPTGAVLNSYKVCNQRAWGIAQNSLGDTYISCADEGKIVRLLGNGTIQTIVEKNGLRLPHGIAWHPDGYLLVAEWGNSRLIKVAVTGEISIFSSGLSSRPINLVIQSADEIFITNDNKGFGGTTTGESQGIDLINANGAASRVLFSTNLFGIASLNGALFASDRVLSDIKPIEKRSLNDTILENYLTGFPAMANRYLASHDLLSQKNVDHATTIIGLAEIRKHLVDENLKSQISSRIDKIVALLRARQSADGGWSVNGTANINDPDNLRKPDSLMTALVGIALNYTTPSAADPVIRNSVTYLLNKQKPGGFWGAVTAEGEVNTSLFTTHLGDTSLVMVYLPRALETIGGLNVKLTLVQPSNVVLSNPSILPTSITPSNDGSISYLWDLLGVKNEGVDIDFDLAIKDLGLKEIRPVSTNAQITFANSFTDEVINNSVAIPSVTTAAAQTLDLKTNKSVYGANEYVNITNVVKSLGSVFGGGSVQLSVRSVDDSSVLAKLVPIAVGTIPVFNTQSVTAEWNTATTMAGAYEIHGQLVDSRNRVIAEAVASITISASSLEGSTLVGASLFADKAEYRVSETVKLDAVVSNMASNTMLPPSLAKLRVVDAQAGVVLEREFAIPQLVSSEQFARQTTLELVGVKPGQYQASWTIYDAAGAGSLASANTTFAVLDDPLRALSGSVTLEHLELDRGALQGCNFVVTNQGTGLLNDIMMKKSVVSIDPELVKEATEEILSIVPAGSQSYSKLFATTGFEKGDYACVLEATIAGQSAVLATAIFTVKESPIKLNGDITLGERARLLVLIDSSATERTYLENLLTNAGWFYTIVDNAAAFATEMNQGGYGAYALLSEKVTLDQTTQASLNAKVAAGDGLVVAGATDRRHQVLEQALGIKTSANESYAKGVAIKDSVLGLAWQRAFNKSSQVLNFTADGATIIGEYKNDLPGADTQTVLGALGAAGRYGNFVWDNFTSLSSTVEGRLAVGGNLSLQNFSVGDKLDPNKLHDVVTVGGNVIFPSGRIYYGNVIAGGSVSGIGDAVRFGMATGATIKGNAPMPINFNVEREYLQQLSSSLATLPANGTVKMQWGGLELKGDCSSRSQVFNVNGADLGVAHTFAVSCIPDNATVVFNVIGQNVSIKSMGMQSLTNIRDKVLFNFPQATSLSMTSVGIEGSILAPFAEVNQPAGRVEGQVIVKSWNSTTSGYMSIHNRFFNGDLSMVTGGANKNALSIYQYQLGKSVFVGFDVLAQATNVGAGNENPFAQLLLAALQQVNPEPITARAGKTLPILVSYENTGAQTASGQVKLVIPANFSVISAANFTNVTNSNDWTAPLELEAGATRTQLLYVKLPQTGGGLLQLQVQTGTSPDWQTRAEKFLNLQP